MLYALLAEICEFHVKPYLIRFQSVEMVKTVEFADL